jgi:hypothetical protein
MAERHVPWRVPLNLGATQDGRWIYMLWLLQSGKKQNIPEVLVTRQSFGYELKHHTFSIRPRSRIAVNDYTFISYLVRVQSRYKVVLSTHLRTLTKVDWIKHVKDCFYGRSRD